jgi:alkylation response protein AidB-like acyl-CoA dehydrogenase
MTAALERVLPAVRRLADETLFPEAMRVDGLDALPAAHLDALAAAGLYGAPVPPQAGGLGLDLGGICAVAEELASGCLATAFVWIQNRGLVTTLATEGAPAALRDRWLGPLCQGQVRGGITTAGLIPGPPLLRAQPADGGWRLAGEAPWVTGWGLVDLLLLVARGPEDTAVTLIVDAAAQPGLTASRQRLSAVNASATVRLRFDGVTVPGERFVSQVPFDPAASLRPDRLRVDGSLALGVARRCSRLLGPGPIDDELAACRERLDDALTADVAAMAQARAAASELTVRAAAALAVHTGSTAVSVAAHPQRLAREALFLLVFGLRPAIKDALLRQLGAPFAGLTGGGTGRSSSRRAEQRPVLET